jgi:AcrR family transcriptional regulator
MAPEARRSMIVAVALDLLVEHGDRVTTRQIAEAAGIAEGTIFRVFADKDELIAAVIDAAVDPAPLEAALDAFDPDLEFRDALRATVVVLQRRVFGVWRLLSSIGPRYHEQARRPITSSDALTRLFARHRACITVEPATAARSLRALTLSTTHPMMIDEPMSPDELVELFLHGIGTREAGAPC